MRNKFGKLYQDTKGMGKDMETMREKKWNTI